MASTEFHSDYIGFLQNRNAELLNRLAKMKEIHQNKILSQDMNQHYLNSTLMDVLNVCASLPEEIDLLFEKLSEAMSILINVLSRKSSLLQLGEKISKILNPPEDHDSVIQNADESSKSAVRAEPRVYLSRLSGDYTPNRRSDNCRLSPIFEMSPSNSPDLNNRCTDTSGNFGNMSVNPAAYSVTSQESPKGRFKGTKLWKKSISSAKQMPNPKKSTSGNENIVKQIEVQPQPSENVPDPDPNPDPPGDPSCVTEEASETQTSPKCYIDYRRRRHRYARIFEKVEDDTSNTKHESAYSSESYAECDNTEDSKNFNKESCDDIVAETPKHTYEECKYSIKKDSPRRREPIVVLEDCMLEKKSPEVKKKSVQNKKEKISQKSTSKCKNESPGLCSSSEKETKEAKESDDSRESTNQEQRVKRKAAPTNLAEPKLGTKLRRN